MKSKKILIFSLLSALFKSFSFEHEDCFNKSAVFPKFQFITQLLFELLKPHFFELLKNELKTHCRYRVHPEIYCICYSISIGIISVSVSFFHFFKGLQSDHKLSEFSVAGIGIIFYTGLVTDTVLGVLVSLMLWSSKVL